eukprot:TRINITY_DN555_c2_g1_i1.p1 TRINITY_DN555_c2_g1~~TRINITY_DN555_c2_g1_i1.p1  ORF type:complete len:380 (+),score=35.01 TRINITY_DN555_c2_g1_i1:114-1253(+)
MLNLKSTFKTSQNYCSNRLFYPVKHFQPQPCSHVINCTLGSSSQIPKVIQTQKPQKSQKIEEQNGFKGEDKDDVPKDELSREYTDVMQQAMGGNLTYDHTKGMNYTLILPDLIVGSCLNSEEDVDTLKKQGVTTILCLQEDSDMDYFGIKIEPIQERCKIVGIQHIREAIHDFDAFDVRKRLPAIVKKLRAVHDEKRGDKLYIHCTAGMGRAPSVAAMYMTWIRGYDLMDAYNLIRELRPCNPNVSALRNATVDLVLGMITQPVTIRLFNTGNYKSVQIIGLDVGWGCKIDLDFDPVTGNHFLKKDLLLGRYMYKFIIDGKYTYSASHPSIQDGDYINNWIEVVSDLSPEQRKTKARLEEEQCLLTSEERTYIQKLMRP